MLEFIKTATAFRKTKANLTLNFIDQNEKTTLSDLYDKAMSFASWILDKKLERKKIALIGRLNVFSHVAWIGCVLGGCSSFPLDSHETGNFQMNKILFNSSNDEAY